ncbi:MAG: hypothetical protein H7203_11540 [Rhizobacter sp.]|nr:hypothetical protein [Burkholderiales bacterium]
MKIINRKTVKSFLAGLTAFCIGVILAMGVFMLFSPNWRVAWLPGVIAVVALGAFFRVKSELFSNFILGAALALGLLSVHFWSRLWWVV